MIKVISHDLVKYFDQTKQANECVQQSTFTCYDSYPVSSTQYEVVDSRHEDEQEAQNIVQSLLDEEGGYIYEYDYHFKEALAKLEALNIGENQRDYVSISFNHRLSSSFRATESFLKVRIMNKSKSLEIWLGEALKVLEYTSTHELEKEARGWYYMGEIKILLNEEEHILKIGSKIINEHISQINSYIIDRLIYLGESDFMAKCGNAEIMSQLEKTHPELKYI